MGYSSHQFLKNYLTLYVLNDDDKRKFNLLLCMYFVHTVTDH